jgi:NAD(P)-dependent dehydrogenase (short-subunit alcohol dehydrogenase family)
MATAIITGGNLGLGFETAKWIAKNLNWTVVLACRSLERGEEAAQKIRKDTGNNKVSIFRAKSNGKQILKIDRCSFDC